MITTGKTDYKNSTFNENLENLENLETSTEIPAKFEKAESIVIATEDGATSSTEEMDTTMFSAKKQKDESKTEPKVEYYLSKKEINNLKRNRYNDVLKKFPNAYVIQNKKTGVIVEMKAATAMHACTMIGWRPRQCKVIEVIKIEEEPKITDAPADTNTTTEIVA